VRTYTEEQTGVLEMLEEIHQMGGDADKYMAKAKIESQS
jgi:hypothetical protein